jgi:hypothetical protein
MVKNPYVPIFDGPEFVGWERECPFCLMDECDCEVDEYDEEGG